jgi:peptidoglycan/LPS O-acetylase OafA/YrhL
MVDERNTPHFSADCAPHYRADIDGLRAIAVIPVVFFHAGVPGFSGGFVGVDVFFVISGYLITQVLMSAGVSPTGSVLADFYIRRCRRILPALLVMMVVVAAVSFFLLLPVDLARFAQFLAMSAIFLGNIAAWLGGGYFDTAGASLLHLWSIGVEEQFYLLYPLLFLIVLRRLPRGRAWPLAALGAASFALCVWASHRFPAANFFLAPTRGWELLAGAVVAAARWRGFGSRILDEFASFAALLTLVCCFTTYHENLAHPGLVTLLPCLATAALLGTTAARRTTVGSFLSLRVFVFTGLISYSLYLWHAPVLSLIRYYDIVAPSPVWLTGQLVFIYLLSAASWRFVETPVRRRQALASDRRFLWTAGAASIALLVLGTWAWRSEGLPQRFSNRVLQLAHTVRRLPPAVARCMTLTPEQIAAGELCKFGSADASRPRVLVWGDSHALALLPAYETLAQSHRLQLFFAGASHCRPLTGVRDRVGAVMHTCERFNVAMIKAVERLDPGTVILNSFWMHPDLDLVEYEVSRAVASGSAFARGIEATAIRVAAPGRVLCAVLDVPTFDWPVPYVLAMSHRKGESADMLRMSRSAALEQQKPVEADFRLLESRGLLRVVDPKKRLCAAEDCAIQRGDGTPLYNDGNHLSAAGALLVAPEIARCWMSAPSGSR